MPAVSAMLQTRIRNLEARSGKKLAQWLDIIRKSKLQRPSEVVELLKTKHGLGHSTASMLFQTFKGGGAAWEENADALVEALFAGKHAPLRPIYEALAVAARSLGPDIRIEPRRTYVALASKAMFGLARPGAGRLDLGLMLPGVRPARRLLLAKSLGSDRITHRIALTRPADVDAEVLRYLAAARERTLP
jgi:hypothetical protein